MLTKWLKLDGSCLRVGPAVLISWKWFQPCATRQVYFRGMMMRFLGKTVASGVLATAAAILGAAGAQAGGFVAPVVEAAPAAVAPVAGAWQGAYAGLTLGYAFNGEDRFGLHDAGDDFLGDVGTLKLKGVNAGLRAGYRWQRSNWVYGPELAFDLGDVKDSVTSSVAGVGTDLTAESKIRNVLSLSAKVGYLAQPDLLVFGKAGAARADVDYSFSGTDDSGASFAEGADFAKTGYILGLGVEKQISDRMSLSGEYEYANFGKETRQFGDNTTEATAKYHNVKLGLNFKF